MYTITVRDLTSETNSKVSSHSTLREALRGMRTVEAGARHAGLRVERVFPTSKYGWAYVHIFNEEDILQFVATMFAPQD